MRSFVRQFLAAVIVLLLSIDINLVVVNCFVIQHQTKSKTLWPSTLYYSMPEYDSVTKTSPHDIQFLGLGTDAIVRPGVILLAPSFEFHHYYRQSAIFVFAMGYENDDDDNGDPIIRGVILDQPTPFTMGEMAGIKGRFANHMLFRGGGVGGDSAMLLHKCVDVATSGAKEEIGTSGIYEGGLTVANDQETCDLQDYKFFFNYCEFSGKELESMLESKDDDSTDAWQSVQVPPSLVLEDWDKGDCWRHLRSVLKQRFATN